MTEYRQRRRGLVTERALCTRVRRTSTPTDGCQCTRPLEDEISFSPGYLPAALPAALAFFLAFFSLVVSFTGGACFFGDLSAMGLCLRTRVRSCVTRTAAHDRPLGRFVPPLYPHFSMTTRIDGAGRRLRGRAFVLGRLGVLSPLVPRTVVQPHIQTGKIQESPGYRRSRPTLAVHDDRGLGGV